MHRPRRARCKLCRTIWSALPEEEILELDDPLPPEEEPRPTDGAWAAVGGWAEPRPLPPPVSPRPDFSPSLERPPPVFTLPVFTPPKDPSAPIYAPPARPSINFEAPPVPVNERSPVRPRLPGPGAYTQTNDSTDDEPPLPDQYAEEWDAEEWDAEDAEPGRRWLWVLLGVAVLAIVAAVLVLTGRVRTEQIGLPPFDPASVSLAGVSLPRVDLPQVAMPQVTLPAVNLPRIALPRALPSPLALEARAERRLLPDNRTVWEVRGSVSNPTAARQPVPPVEIILLDAGGVAVARWTVRPETTNLPPGGVARFETSAIDPPPTTQRVRLQLKPAELGRL